MCIERVTREESVRYLIALVYDGKNEAAVKLYESIQWYCADVLWYTKNVPNWKIQVYNSLVENSELIKEEKEKIIIGI